MSQSSHPKSLESGQNFSSNVNNLSDDPKNVYEVLDAETVYESPIDLNISTVIPVNAAPQLNWINYELPPKKMKITNTGHTVILSGKWGQERPYITNGVLTGKYVFSQMHLHWGSNDMEGSEHTIDGGHYPGELHVVMFKSCYLTQESALKEKDGIAILVYILKLQDPPNPDFQPIINALPAITKAHTSIKITPVQLGYLLRQFESDYFMYQGSVKTTNCVHHIRWLITRIPIGASADQMDSLRFLLDNDDEIIKRNFRPVQPINNRHVFHILPSTSKYSTLLPVPVHDVGEKTITQIYQMQLLYNNRKLRQKIKRFRRAKQFQSVQSLNKKMQLTDKDLVQRTISVISNFSKYMDFIYYFVFALF